MKTLRTLILVAGVASALSAQESSAWRGFSLGATVGLNYADSRAFTNRTESWGGEATLDLMNNKDVINARVFVGTLRSVGKDRPDLGTAFNLQGWRSGVDLTFNTPITPLKAYAGVNFNWWTGDSKNPTNLPVGGTGKPVVSFTDGAAKLGWRLGAEYRVTKAFAVSADFNVSEWRHDNKVNTRPIKGLNPVNPTWAGITLRYYPQ